MLSELSKTQSRASLISLRQDLIGISEVAFLELLDGFSTKKPKQATKKSRSKKATGPADDRPVTRIAHQLRLLGLADARAALRLQEGLLASGVRPDFVPAISEPLEHWLDVLLGRVPDSKVMILAKKLKA